MSTEQEQARLLAERIARRLGKDEGATAPREQEKNEVGHELANVRASLDELQRKLHRIESRLTHEGDANSNISRSAVREASEVTPRQSRPSSATPASSATHSPWLSGMYVPATSHPSQERFGVEEAAVAELVDFFEREKTCELEPGGKPCDHCSMCSSRGF